MNFLSLVVAELGLTNVEIHGSFPNERLSGFFLVRAVFPVPELLEFVRSRMKVGSRVMVNLGGDAARVPVQRDYRSLCLLRYKLPANAGFRLAEVLEFVPRETF